MGCASGLWGLRDWGSIMCSINAKLDHLTEQRDHLKERMDGHDTHLEQVESRTSDLEDSQRGDEEKLLQMERVLEFREKLSEYEEVALREQCFLGREAKARRYGAGEWTGRTLVEMLH
ncbi:hypothetical protein NDU88_002321 [Pleurodeles waltl]|uniref:Uncharacterized protein n=1 Tax=Pleurodeles waltl TaxID=8319 RepID=A0AAV7TKD5_PLEWA|nr:hypothetical protein NDU88_002321 [Pleurodeles waltl]